jgi:hypothetical protein
MKVLAPFHYGLFYHAMIALLGREPDKKYSQGFDGYYTFRYEPRNESERRKFEEHTVTLRQWLSIFELTPLDSRCDFGKLVHPRPEEEGKDYLDIVIAYPVPKREMS